MAEVKLTDKQRALSRKEGAKKGQDLSGLQDMGGVSFFHVALENCKGNWELVQEAMDGANTPVEPGAEERKGGADKIAKAFLSASDDRLCIYLHVPEELSDKGVTLPEWFDVLVKASNATVLTAPTEYFGFAKAEFLGGPERFPLKVRDATIGLGFAYLRGKGVIPEDDTSDEYPEGNEQDELEW
jgi:hypothetical protein